VLEEEGVGGGGERKGKKACSEGERADVEKHAEKPMRHVCAGRKRDVMMPGR
jgi:hypothetical protein